VQKIHIQVDCDQRRFGEILVKQPEDFRITLFQPDRNRVMADVSRYIRFGYSWCDDFFKHLRLSPVMLSMTLPEYYE
jgi:hypothetical protein